MPLSAGTRVGPYEILAPIGAGGRGEVPRHPPRPDDSIKISSTQSSERSEREALAIAAFSYRAVCAVPLGVKSWWQQFGAVSEWSTLRTASVPPLLAILPRSTL